MTRADLAEAVCRKVGLLRTESAELVEAVLDEICEAIVRGEAVKLSSFATFHVRDKNERVGRNPKTGEKVPILPRRVITFKASKVMKGRILHRISKGRTDPAYGSEQTKGRLSQPRPPASDTSAIL